MGRLGRERHLLLPLSCTFTTDSISSLLVLYFLPLQKHSPTLVDTSAMLIGLVSDYVSQASTSFA